MSKILIGSNFIITNYVPIISELCSNYYCTSWGWCWSNV